MSIAMTKIKTATFSIKSYGQGHQGFMSYVIPNVKFFSFTVQKF